MELKKGGVLMGRIWLRLVCGLVALLVLGCEGVEWHPAALKGHALVMTYEVRTLTGENDAQNRRAFSPPGNTWFDELTILTFGRFLSGNFEHDVYVRFPVDFTQIPRYAKVVSAYIEFEPRGSESEIVNLLIQLLDSANCPSFVTDQSGLGTDGASVIWANVPAWVVDTPVQSPDIATEVQRWIDKAAKVATPFLGFRFVENGSDLNALRSSYSAEGDATKSPLLHITYILPELLTADGTIWQTLDADGLIRQNLAATGAIKQRHELTVERQR
jgi:hypothetical protein